MRAIQLVLALTIVALALCVVLPFALARLAMGRSLPRRLEAASVKGWRNTLLLR